MAMAVVRVLVAVGESPPTPIETLGGPVQDSRRPRGPERTSSSDRTLNGTRRHSSCGGGGNPVCSGGRRTAGCGGARRQIQLAGSFSSLSRMVSRPPPNSLDRDRLPTGQARLAMISRGATNYWIMAFAPCDRDSGRQDHVQSCF
ncbi:hypothetical protein LCI18_004868 [Fusarium solani-melongenae]|uniref:Uncharacterized protein n=1 Tax=Fusarium solani subsp. cucurbitae TaxID=2747967 RepID=A0ACD3Z1E4_FUSSC|nr:hypothetical protein LCI18_004868 [Fusarium solani-melongenae]